jgi:hypothetical protein
MRCPMRPRMSRREQSTSQSRHVTGQGLERTETGAPAPAALPSSVEDTSADASAADDDPGPALSDTARATGLHGREQRPACHPKTPEWARGIRRWSVDPLRPRAAAGIWSPASQPVPANLEQRSVAGKPDAMREAVGTECARVVRWTADIARKHGLRKPTLSLANRPSDDLVVRWSAYPRGDSIV